MHPTTGHGVELPFVFHSASLGGFNYTPEELQLSDNMVHYWTNFTHYGDPNGLKEGVRYLWGGVYGEMGRDEGEVGCGCGERGEL